MLLGDCFVEKTVQEWALLFRTNPMELAKECELCRTISSCKSRCKRKITEKLTTALYTTLQSMMNAKLSLHRF